MWGLYSALVARHARCSTPDHAQGSHSMVRRRYRGNGQRRDRGCAAAADGRVAARGLGRHRRGERCGRVDPAARRRPCSMNDCAGSSGKPGQVRPTRSRSFCPWGSSCCPCSGSHRSGTPGRVDRRCRRSARRSGRLRTRRSVHSSRRYPARWRSPVGLQHQTVPPGAEPAYCRCAATRQDRAPQVAPCDRMAQRPRTVRRFRQVVLRFAAEQHL